MTLTRRRLLETIAGVWLSAPSAPSQTDDGVGAPLPPWKPGILDIHQISTGRGNSALFILPDGNHTTGGRRRGRRRPA